MAGFAASAVVVVVALLCVAQPSGAVWHEERAFSAFRGRELTLETAKALHPVALNAARRKERAHGHVRQLAEPPLMVPSLGEAERHVVNPIRYGADPTGKKDSTEAFRKAIKELVETRKDTHYMAINITDLGGQVLDLEGGQYLISESLLIPPFVGNLHISDGTLRASPTFPRDDYLIAIGDQHCNGGPQGSCNENIGLENLLLDAAHQAAGGVFITHVMGATIRNCFVVGFPKVGILIDDGHEVMVIDSWLTENYWSGPSPSNSTSIGVLVNGNDHFLNNVIVFAFTKTGVIVNGAANILSGVHTWNGGGLGIVVNSWQTRLIGCYLDYDYLQILDPYNVVVENTFFLGTRTIVQPSKAVINGFIMRFNTYTGGTSVVINGSFPRGQVHSLSITDEAGGTVFSEASGTVTRNASTQFEFDFSHELIFPWIDEVFYSVVSSSDGFVRHTARQDGAKVIVEMSEPVDASVSVRVVQCPMN